MPTALAAQRDAREEDARRLAQRQKQIDFGKNTRGYERYSALVPREKRRFDDPWTPDKTAPCSKRAFDGRIRKWRRELHKYDEEIDGEQKRSFVLGQGGSFDQASVWAADLPLIHQVISKPFCDFPLYACGGNVRLWAYQLCIKLVKIWMFDQFLDLFW